MRFSSTLPAEPRSPPYSESWLQQSCSETPCPKVMPAEIGNHGTLAHAGTDLSMSSGARGIRHDSSVLEFSIKEIAGRLATVVGTRL